MIANLRLRISAELSPMVLGTGNLVNSINDMSGSGTGVNFVGTTTTRPRWMLRGLALPRPVIVFDGAVTKLASSAAFAQAQPVTMVAVFENWKQGVGNSNLWADSGVGPTCFLSGGTSWSMYSGATVSNATLGAQNRQGCSPQMPNAMCCLIAVFNGAASVLSNNGVEVVMSSSGATNTSGTHFLGTDNTGGQAVLHLYEYLIFSRVLTLAERGLLNAYYAAACGFAL